VYLRSCPTRAELSSYLLGKLQEERLDAVADHVDDCTSCQAVLKTLEDVQDSLVPQLRGQPVSLPTPDPELQCLLGLVKTLRPQQQLTDTAGAAAFPPTAEGNAPGGEAAQLGQYRLLEKIGQGGMGAVYKARHLRLDRIVALKVLPAERAHAPEDVARFEREMRAVGKLNHPNIVRATDAGEADGVPFLVMELVEGTDLQRLVQQRGPLPLAEACELVRQAAMGLQHAHEHGLVHRDVKPSNLLLSAEGQVKVLDLGLARSHGGPSAGPALTGPGNAMGTLDYMAPEQAQDARSVDIRADVYSLGCTLYHLLAGQPPFGGAAYPGAAQKLSAHLHTPPASVQTHRPDVPNGLATLVDRLLAKRPGDRPPSPSAVAEALAAFAVDCDLSRLLGPAYLPTERAADTEVPAPHDTKRSGPSRAQATPLQQAPSTQRSRLRGRVVALLAGAVLAASVVIAAVFWWLSGDNSRDPSGQGQDDPNKVAERPAPKDDKGEPSRPGQDKAPPAPKKKNATPKQEPTLPPKKDAEPPPPTKEAAGQLAERGVALLKMYCYRCHGIDFKVPRFNVLDRPGLVATRGKAEPTYVVPGKPDESYLWQRVGVDNDMPPRGKQPSGAEKAILKEWIAAGAPFPGRPARAFKSEKTVLHAIHDHLRKTAPEVRRFQRYFTLTHLYNNHQHVSADELRLYRAALAKLVNSLSWKRTLVVPRAVDAEETVFAVDLRHLGWEAHDLWKEILRAYPYGLTHGRAADAALRNLARDVYDLAGTDVPYLRADWFIATASQPPLYHTLLRLPAHARDLERQLKVDVRQDFLDGKLARAGLTRSGVSKQNRLLDRHDAAYGAYWKSYDFKSDDGTGNLVHFPLGPRFEGHPFPRHAFGHAGGEIIFNLPNGLQGYLLVDEKDRRIDLGPVDIVRDGLETAGTPQIVNGLSCMACHKHGMIRFEDRLRAGTSLKGDARVKVHELFRTKDEMDRLLAKDEDRFLRAVDKATGAFLKVGEDRGKNIRDFPEPIGAIARLYVRNLGLEEVAYELGIEPVTLKTFLANNPRLRALGLGPLAVEGTIPRSVWSSPENVLSLFQDVARELELGTPIIVR
jgi:serine/threonine-protein kinase